MSTLDQKLKQLEEAASASSSILGEKESALASASEAVEKAKAKLKSLSQEAQEALQFNDTELPELISAKMLAQSEYDEAKKRHETNQKYVLILREKVSGGK